MDLLFKVVSSLSLEAFKGGWKGYTLLGISNSVPNQLDALFSDDRFSSQI